MEVSGQFRATFALPSGKEPPVPIGQEAGWTPVPVWKKNPFIAAAGNQTPVFQYVAQSLYRLALL
jgi:hypothetical protein